VADFGLAAKLEFGQVAASIPQPTHPLWVAPEVYWGRLQGPYDVTRFTDILALGKLVRWGLCTHQSWEARVQWCAKQALLHSAHPALNKVCARDAPTVDCTRGVLGLLARSLCCDMLH
jgi:hypothetical protein